MPTFKLQAYLPSPIPYGSNVIDFITQKLFAFSKSDAYKRFINQESIEVSIFGSKSDLIVVPRLCPAVLIEELPDENETLNEVEKAKPREVSYLKVVKCPSE